ncbi:indolepyruvate ferredoxin oxidoreductase alpha subunit [Peptoniphilus olsenii]|uniref:Indolepyruvate oxidoreductase subunit IorA n=1 Tax=Peptoniphilus olsenii TaxID=411570 RepID=A0ABV2J723_9FIRM
MTKKEVLSGNQAIARGFYEAGGQVATAYPGSPTVEIIDSMRKYDEIYSEFSTNEKVALEVGIGATFGGVRSLVAMKHVGVNICMDPLMTFVQSPIESGFLLITGDDPGMASSQNEQDNRILGKFANMAIFDPSDSQESKDYVKIALDLSEKYNCPMMMRITSRLCHSRSLVELEDRKQHDGNPFKADPTKYCMLPPHTFAHQYSMKERIENISEWSNDSSINKFKNHDGDTLIITSGMAYNNFKEVASNISVLKLGMIYPLPIKKIKEISKNFDRIIVIEEMMPFIENELKINGISCEGKKYFSFTGELMVEDIEDGLIKAGVLTKRTIPEVVEDDTTVRGPLFCAGCPHRPVFDILKKAKVTVVGDIGCYTMGLLYPFEVINMNISMGASVGMIKGLRFALDKLNDDRPLVGVIGDGTFFHSGLPGFANLRYQLKGNEKITMIVLDNGTTAMTGGQPTASSYQRDNIGQDISIDDILKDMGYKDIERIDQFNYKEAKQKINDAINREGVSIIITSRPCALKFKIKEPNFYVDPKVCIGCRTCIKTNCPPLRMKKYKGIDKKKSSIDPKQCVGCSICAQVCPVGAIKRRNINK